MKKWLLAVGFMVGFCGMSYAGGIQATYYQGQPPLYSTELVGSTSTTSGTGSLSLSLAPGTVNGNSCRNCFTKFIVQIPTSTIINVLDAGTTVQIFDGVAIASSGVNTLTVDYGSLSPLCLGFGNTTTINGTVTGGIATQHQVINYEGAIICGGAGGSISNSGK